MKAINELLFCLFVGLLPFIYTASDENCTNGLEDCTQKKVKTQQSGDMLHISMENMTWDEFSEYMKEIVKQVSELKLKDPTTEQSVLPNKACPDGDNAECLESEPKLKKKRSKKAKRNGKKRRKSKAKQRLLKELNSINELENIETWPVINEKSQPNPSASTNEDLVKCTASEATNNECNGKYPELSLVNNQIKDFPQTSGTGSIKESTNPTLETKVVKKKRKRKPSKKRAGHQTKNNPGSVNTADITLDTENPPNELLGHRYAEDKDSSGCQECKTYFLACKQDFENKLDLTERSLLYLVNTLHEEYSHLWTQEVDKIKNRLGHLEKYLQNVSVVKDCSQKMDNVHNESNGSVTQSDKSHGRKIKIEVQDIATHRKVDVKNNAHRSNKTALAHNNAELHNFTESRSTRICVNCPFFGMSIVFLMSLTFLLPYGFLFFFAVAYCRVATIQLKKQIGLHLDITAKLNETVDEKINLKSKVELLESALPQAEDNLRKLSVEKDELDIEKRNLEFQLQHVEEELKQSKHDVSSFAKWMSDAQSTVLSSAIKRCSILGVCSKSAGSKQGGTVTLPVNATTKEISGKDNGMKSDHVDVMDNGKKPNKNMTTMTGNLNSTSEAMDNASGIQSPNLTSMLHQTLQYM